MLIMENCLRSVKIIWKNVCSIIISFIYYKCNLDNAIYILERSSFSGRYNCHDFWLLHWNIPSSPCGKRCRGVIRPESSPHVFLLPKTLNLKKKSGSHLSVVAFSSERPLTENIYTFWNVFAATYTTNFKGFNFIEL